MKDLGLLYRSCTLCPRECGSNRYHTTGYCNSGSTPSVNTAMLHFGEEPVLAWDKGSGAVFFEGCSLRCPFCQNYAISSGVTAKGTLMDASALSELFLGLEEKGAANIDLVTPDHFIPTVAEAVSKVRHRIGIPFIMNCSGYEKRSTLKILDGLIDIYMPDMKFYSADLSWKMIGVRDYFEVASGALEEMFAQTGPFVTGEDGLMKKGLLVRHLMMPGCLFDSKKVVDYLWEKYGNDIYLSLMDQYTPMPQLGSHPNADPRLLKKLDPRHYRAMADHVYLLGMKNVFLQEDASGDEMIPDFN